MDLSPEAIRAAAFRRVKRGYDPDEVEEFRAKVAELVEQLQGQSATMEARARAAVAKLQELAEQQGRIERLAPAEATDGLVDEVPVGTSDSPEVISRTLMLAQRTADEALSAAREEAARLLDSARAMANRTIDDARHEARRASEDERIRAENEVHALLARRDFLLGDVEHLEEFLSAEQERLRRVAEHLLGMAGAAPMGLGTSRRPLLSASDDTDSFWDDSEADDLGREPVPVVARAGADAPTGEIDSPDLMAVALAPSATDSAGTDAAHGGQPGVGSPADVEVDESTAVPGAAEEDPFASFVSEGAARGGEDALVGTATHWPGPRPAAGDSGSADADTQADTGMGHLSNGALGAHDPEPHTAHALDVDEDESWEPDTAERPAHETEPLVHLGDEAHDAAVGTPPHGTPSSGTPARPLGGALPSMLLGPLLPDGAGAVDEPTVPMPVTSSPAAARWPAATTQGAQRPASDRQDEGRREPAPAPRSIFDRLSEDEAVVTDVEVRTAVDGEHDDEGADDTWDPLTLPVRPVPAAAAWDDDLPVSAAASAAERAADMLRRTPPGDASAWRTSASPPARQSFEGLADRLHPPIPPASAADDDSSFRVDGDELL